MRKIGLLNWFKGNFFSTETKVEVFNNLSLKLYYKELAIQSTISLIANALILSEFQTYEKGGVEKGDKYYLFNIEPNSNQNATEFWHEVISKLVYKNECLIIENNKRLYVAESYTHEEKAFTDDLYKNVSIRGLSLTGVYKESDVLFLKLNDDSIKKLIDGLYADYGELIETAKKGYKRSLGIRGILKIDTVFSQKPDAQKKIDDIFDNKFNKYFNDENAVLSLEKGLDFEEKPNTNPTKNSRDVRALIDDIIDFVSMAFHVPGGLIRGDVAGVKEQTDNFLMFCLNPIAKLITSEINRKLYMKEGFLKKSYVKVDTQKIKDVDIKGLSSAADMLFRIGVNSIDDNLIMLGREPLKTKWSEEHYVTKNYQSVLNPALQGGASDGTKNSNNGTQG